LLFCGSILLQAVAAQDVQPPESGQIRLDSGGAARLTIDPALGADQPASYDPFYDLRARQSWYSDEPVMGPTLLLELPKSYFEIPAADQTSLWSETLKGRVDAIAQPKSFSISDTTCQLGGSFADCMLPKLPCAFRLGVFGLGSQESHGPLVRESYDFNFLSSRCAL
jgi:hypothetical protein